MNINHDLNIKITQVDKVVVAVFFYGGGGGGVWSQSVSSVSCACLYCTARQTHVTLVETSNSRYR